MVPPAMPDEIAFVVAGGDDGHVALRLEPAQRRLLATRMAQADAPRAAVAIADDAHVAAGIHDGVGDAVALQHGDGAVDGVALGDAAEVQLGRRVQPLPAAGGVDDVRPLRAPHQRPQARHVRRGGGRLGQREAPEPIGRAQGGGEGAVAPPRDGERRLQQARHLVRQRDGRAGRGRVEGLHRVGRIAVDGERALDAPHLARGVADGGQRRLPRRAADGERDQRAHQEARFLHVLGLARAAPELRLNQEAQQCEQRGGGPPAGRGLHRQAAARRPREVRTMRLAASR